MKKIPFILLTLMLALVMAIGFVPTNLTSADVEPTIVGNYGFVPNSGEASVSKVDLITGNTVARYWTAPRLEQDDNTVPPYAWRTSRCAMALDGSAWVLNVGADAYLNDYDNDPVDYSLGYDPYVPADGLVGSVVRIEGDVEAAGLTPGVDTSDNHSSPMTFGTDEAVQVFPIGDVGDMPRAIDIDANGDIWVGFYGGKYFQKYQYDGDNLTAVGAPITGNFSPYQAWIDKNGILWFSSRNNANPHMAADNGIYYFDTDTQNPGSPTRIDLGVNPYAILIDNSAEDAVVWATAYNSNLYKIEGYSLNMTVAITDASQLRGMRFDGAGIIWMANTIDDTVCWYDPVGNTSGESGVIAGGANPVGVGRDAAGNMWAICRNDSNLAGFIAMFAPTTPPAGFTPTYVGYRPYAYGDFAQIAPPEGRICGSKYLGAEGEEGIEGWTIFLYEEPLAPGATPNTTSADAWTTTDADGNFCFDGLELPGTYYIYEEIRECCWVQIVDLGEGLPEFYEIELTTEDPDSSGNIFRNIPLTECRWTGGGTIDTGAIIPNGVRVTHGFELHCNLNVPNNLEVNWGGNRFHLEELLSADCFMDPMLPEPNMPVAGCNTIIAHGVGRYNGTSGYTIDFKFTDVGEPGKNDFASINVTAPGGTVVLQVSGNLKNGNQQAHIDNKPVK